MKCYKILNEMYSRFVTSQQLPVQAHQVRFPRVWTASDKRSDLSIRRFKRICRPQWEWTQNVIHVAKVDELVDIVRHCFSPKGIFPSSQSLKAMVFCSCQHFRRGHRLWKTENSDCIDNVRPHLGPLVHVAPF